MRLERGEKLGQDGVDGQDFRHLGAYPSSTTAPPAAAASCASCVTSSTGSPYFRLSAKTSGGPGRAAPHRGARTARRGSAPRAGRAACASAPRAPPGRRRASPDRGRQSPPSPPRQAPPRRRDVARCAALYVSVKPDQEIAARRRDAEAAARPGRAGRCRAARGGSAVTSRPFRTMRPAARKSRPRKPADEGEQGGLADARGPHHRQRLARPDQRVDRDAAVSPFSQIRDVARAPGRAPRTRAHAPDRSSRRWRKRIAGTMAATAKPRNGSSAWTSAVAPIEPPVAAGGERHRLGRDRRPAPGADEQRRQIEPDRDGEAERRRGQHRAGEHRQADPPEDRVGAAAERVDDVAVARIPVAPRIGERQQHIGEDEDEMHESQGGKGAVARSGRRRGSAGRRETRPAARGAARRAASRHAPVPPRPERASNSSDAERERHRREAATRRRAPACRGAAWQGRAATRIQAASVREAGSRVGEPPRPGERPERQKRDAARGRQARRAPSAQRRDARSQRIGSRAPAGIAQGGRRG